MELKLKMNHISYSILKSGTNCSEVSSGTTEITKLGTLWVRNTAETRTSIARKVMQVVALVSPVMMSPES